MVTADYALGNAGADTQLGGGANMDIPDWKLFWSDLRNRGSEMCTPCSTREAALWTACHSLATEPPLRIEGPSGEVIAGEEIRQYCRAQACR
jgi:hypothetical protein